MLEAGFGNFYALEAIGIHMINELRYQVRSREIVDLFNAMRSGRLTLSPYFQRNLVWRDAHKRDFIDTILKGFPFPQIFLARGPIDLDTMAASQCVVDGQQRLSTIRQFIEGGISVSGKNFVDLNSAEKEDFLKYEIAVIDFDLDVGDQRLKEIFHRLNRTYYSLSAIEKIASEYSASEFLLLARLLSGEISNSEDSIPDELIEDDVVIDQAQTINSFMRDPDIDEAHWDWLQKHADGPYADLITSSDVFTNFEFDRKVPLMFTLNVMGTYLSGYFNRNDKVRRFLEDKNSDFPERNEVLNALNDAALFIEEMEIPDDDIWWSKANFFTLICEVSRNEHIRDKGPAYVRNKLDGFAANVPAEYLLAAREAVGRKNQRELRARLIREAILA